MKKVIYLFAIIATTLSFTSCSSDDDDTPKEEQIIGKWKLIESKMNDVVDNDFPCDFEGILEYNINGTFTQEVYESDVDDNCTFSYSDSGTWTNNDNGTYTYQLNDDKSHTNKIEFNNTTYIETIVDGTDTYQYTYKKQ